MNRTGLSPARVAVALALLLGLQPVTIDLVLPTLPALARELAVPPGAAQLTLSTLILAFGLSQLFWGPVSDRFGRRPVLLGALAAHGLAGVAAALAPSLQALVVARTVQGAALAAAVVCGRALVRDLYEPQQGAQVTSCGFTGVGVCAVASPAVGGALAALFGWRTALAVVAASGLGVALFVWRALPETLRQRDPLATRLAPLAATTRRVLAHPTFVAWAALLAATYGGLFTVLAGSSFLYIGRLGLTPAQYGAAMASSALAFIVGTLVCRRWLARHGLAATVRRAAAFTLAAGLAAAAAALLQVPSVWAVLLPQTLYVFGHGIHQPCAVTGAVGPFPQAAGVASALAGFVLAAVAFATGLAVGVATGHDPWAVVHGLAAWAFVTAAVAWTLVQRHALAPEAAA